MNTFRGIRILVFFATPGEKGGKEFVSPSSKEEKKKEEKKWYEGTLDLVGNVLKAGTKLSSAYLSSDPKVKDAVTLLQTTGTIPSFDKMSGIGIMKRFFDGIGESGAIAVIQAIEMAEQGTLPLIIYSNSNYRTVSKATYEMEVSTNPESFNAGVAPGLLRLAQINSPLGFTEKTWKNISIYCASKNWDTNIVRNKATQETYPGGEKIRALYEITKQEGEKDMTRILNNTLSDIKQYDNELAELLSKKGLKLLPSGSIDAEEAIRNGNIKNAVDVPEFFKKLSDSLRNDSIKLLGKAKEYAGKSSSKHLQDLKITISGVSGTKIFGNYTQKEANKILPEIEQFRLSLQKSSQKDQKIKDLDYIIVSLLALIKGIESGRQAGDTHEKARTAKKITDTAPSDEKEVTAKEIGKTLNSEKNQQRGQIAGDIASARIETENVLDSLKEYHINSLDEAQKELQRIQTLTRPLSRKEEILQSTLVGYIQGKKKEANIYTIGRKILGENEAQEIFTSTNRFITGNAQEVYDFKILEKTVILTDSESTPGEKNLARMQPGDSLNMIQIIEGTMHMSVMNAPELTSIRISMNQDGTYDIPFFQAKNISKEQVEEYKEDALMYAELGLSQFIPFIPRITDELRMGGVTTSIDGQMGTMEQQQILKYLYRLLFGKEITSTNLADVKRAFFTSLGGPTNMKGAMQNTLKRHKLINESSQPIREDMLRDWIRSNGIGIQNDKILDTLM